MDFLVRWIVGFCGKISLDEFAREAAMAVKQAGGDGDGVRAELSRQDVVERQIVVADDPAGFALRVDWREMVVAVAAMGVSA